jgi:dipeptidyl aminopeptidase/acylaminoacyl peptidase
MVGGEAQSLTDTEESIGSFIWFPDGKSMVLVMRTGPATSDEDEGPKPDVREHRDSKYKANGIGYLDEKRSHLWRFDLDSGELTQLTDGEAWNDSNPTVSPDGQWVAFDSDRTGDEYEGGSNDDVWIVPSTGGNIRKLTTHPHRDGSPLWSPDGRHIVYSRTDEPYAQSDLFVIPLEGGEPRRLTGAFDHNPRNVKWASGGESLYLTADDRGTHPLFRLNVETGDDEKIVDEPVRIANLDVSRDGKTLAFTLEDERRLAEVWVLDTATGTTKALSSFNVEFLDALALQPAEEFWFTNDADMKVQGFLVRPVNWQPGEKYPLVLNIHGGPSGMWGHSWFHEFQMLAARGYAICFINYRGSTGYGFDFQKTVRRDYGGVDYRDNMQGLDAVLEQYDWIDSERLGVTGGSHGGFLTNWIISQTDRFKAAVTQRSVSNWISAAGQQQYTPREMRIEFGGTLWENYDLYWDRSPLQFADRIKTPTLIIHSDQDYICPLGQAEELFYALKIHDVPVELAVFEGENHNLSRTGKPVNLVERLNRMLEWFERYLPPNGQT